MSPAHSAEPTKGDIFMGRWDYVYAASDDESAVQ